MSAEAGLALLIFARAPVTGAAKTRLLPELGPQAAARLQARMTRRILAIACDAQVGSVQLWCAPSTEHEFFRSCRRSFPVSLHVQSGHTLGERMRFAHDSAFRTHARVLLVGTDCPMLTAGHLRSAVEDLSQYDAAIIPAEDGGYVLLGLSQPCPLAFEDMPWGADTVLERTVARLQALGKRCRLQEPLWDVDRPEDYRRLATCLPELVEGLDCEPS